MNKAKTINTAEASGILTVDLIDYAPTEKSTFLDLKDFLYQGLIVKEKEFKQQLAETDWEQYKDKAVAIGCSEDTIIPPWVYMMISCYLDGIATGIDFCTPDELDIRIWKKNIETADFSRFTDEKVVVRARFDMEAVLYSTLSQKLKPIVKTLLYGEAGLPKVIWKKK